MRYHAISCDIARYRMMNRAISHDIARCIVRYRMIFLFSQADLNPSHTHLGLRRRQPQSVCFEFILIVPLLFICVCDDELYTLYENLHYHLNDFVTQI